MGRPSVPPGLSRARALPDGRCPRCGGIGQRPQRRRANPFLSEPPPGALVCQDCGLDFEDEQGVEGDAGDKEGRPPWSS